MGFNLKNNRGVICDPVYFRDTTNVTAQNIAYFMSEKANELNIPMNVKVDTIKEGGLFGSTYECVVINHPNPPQQYFTDVIIINGNTVNFYFFGNSEANYKTNKANQRKGSLSGMILNSLSGSNEIALQTEMSWHQSVIEVFNACVE